jgi:hypothetical protein
VVFEEGGDAGEAAPRPRVARRRRPLARSEPARPVAGGLPTAPRALASASHAALRRAIVVHEILGPPKGLQ